MYVCAHVSVCVCVFLYTLYIFKLLCSSRPGASAVSIIYSNSVVAEIEVYNTVEHLYKGHKGTS